MALWDEVTHWDGHWGWCSYGSVTDASVHDSCVMKTYYMGMSVSYTETRDMSVRKGGKQQSVRERHGVLVGEAIEAGN